MSIGIVNMKKIALLLILFILCYSACDPAIVNPGGNQTYPWAPLRLQSHDLPSVSATNVSSYRVDLNAHSYKIIVISNYTEAQFNNDPGWWHDAVVYEVFTPQFNNGALPTSRLEYLDELGIDAIWTTPIFDSPTEHGYDVSDYYQVKPSMGGNAAYDDYVEQAHSRDIKIILDMVINHAGNQNQWFIDSALGLNGKKDWFIWTNKATDLSAWISPMDPSNAIWVSTALNANEYYFAIFNKIQPDLNLKNPEVVQEMKNIAYYWLINKKADGFRLDAVRYFLENGPSGMVDSPDTIQFLIDFQSYLESIKPQVYTIGEVWDGMYAYWNYWNSGKSCQQLFNFDFKYALTTDLNNGNANTLRDMFANWKPSNSDWYDYGQFLDNHDWTYGNLNRITDQLGNDPEKDRIAAAITLTSIGTPYIYYGTEIGMSRGPQYDDAAKRTPMEWDTVTEQCPDPSSLLNTYRSLIHLRKKYQALRRGQQKNIPSSDSRVYSFIRTGTGASVIVVANLSDTNVSSYLNLSAVGLSGSTVYQPVQVLGDERPVLNPENTLNSYYSADLYTSLSDPFDDEMLLYPTNYTYVDGVGDIRHLDVYTLTNQLSSRLRFEVTMEEMVNSWSGTHGFDHTCIIIYMQKPSSSSTTTKFWSFSRDWRSELFYDAVSGWDYCVVASGNGAAIYGPDSTNKIQAIDHGGNVNTKKIWIEIQDSVLGVSDGDYSDYRFVLFTYDWEDWGYGQITPENPNTLVNGFFGTYRMIAQTNTLSEWNYQALDLNWDSETLILDMLGTSPTNLGHIRWEPMPDSEWITLVKP